MCFAAFLELRHANVHRPERRRVHALGRLHQLPPPAPRRCAGRSCTAAGDSGTGQSSSRRPSCRSLGGLRVGLVINSIPERTANTGETATVIETSGPASLLGRRQICQVIRVQQTTSLPRAGTVSKRRNCGSRKSYAGRAGGQPQGSAEHLPSEDALREVAGSRSHWRSRSRWRQASGFSQQWS